jgi:hypothetical protein
MLTEGWDANTVTHILGVRAFGTQLLCEQVVGRALRRQSYELNDEGLFNVEYADVLGIPFDFAAKPVVAPPQPPRETVQVRRSGRIATRWRSLPAGPGLPGRTAGRAAEAEFNPDSRAAPDAGSGRAVQHHQPGHHRRRRRSDGGASRGHALARPILFHLVARHLLYTSSATPARSRSCTCSASSSASRGSGSRAFSLQVGGTYPAQLLYQGSPTWPASASRRRSPRRSPATARSRRSSTPTTHRLDRVRQLHHLEGDPLADRPAQVPRQLGGLRQRLGGRVLPRRRGPPGRARLRQEPEPGPGSAVPDGGAAEKIHPRLHRPGDDGTPIRST